MKDYGPPVEEYHSTEWFPNQKTGKPRKKPKLLAQVLSGGLCLAGRYTMKKSTRTGGIGYSGGVDGFYPMVELQDLIKMLSDKYPHVLFESLLISGTQQRWVDFAKERPDKDVIYATLDTPLQTCLDRVQQRNGGREVKEDQIERHRNQVMKCAQRFHNEGLRSFMIDHNHSYEQIKQFFLDDGWNPSVGSQGEQAVQSGDPLG